jgi:Bacteriophage replication protein O
MLGSFPGFRGPNYTPVPDELFDQLLPDLTLAELRVLLYVMRRTFGFKKGSDRISKSQLENGIVKNDGRLLDRGTGLSRRSVRVAIYSLCEKGILLKRARFSASKGHEATEYALNIIGQDPWVQTTQGGADPGVQSTQAPSSPARETLNVLTGTQGLGTLVPPQDTVDKSIINVNVLEKFKKTGTADLRAQALAFDILEVCKDSHSMGSYVHIARTYPEQLVREALSLTKDQAARGRIRKSRGAYFTDTVARLARTRGFQPPGSDSGVTAL